jgi:hypothetical protein
VLLEVLLSRTSKASKLSTFCTSNASNLSTWMSEALEVLLEELLSRMLLLSSVCAATSEGL